MQRFAILLCWFGLVACQSQAPLQQTAASRQAIAATGMPAPDNAPLLFYTERVADRLFQGVAPLPRGPIAVVSFTEMRGLKPDPYNVSMNMLGLQLQESMLTVASQRGYDVKEIRLADAIAIYPDHEQMLTRDLTRLAQQQSVRYIIVGTMNQSEQFTTVNARMVDVQTHQVVAATSDLVPATVLGSTEDVQLRQQRLYRNSSAGTP